jgi:hypothetical protein
MKSSKNTQEVDKIRNLVYLIEGYLTQLLL